jgi:hypothetical protein
MSADSTASARKRMPFLSTLNEKSFVINIRMTPPKERNNPRRFIIVSFSRKTKYAIRGEKTGIVAITTEVVVGEEYLSP